MNHNEAIEKLKEHPEAKGFAGRFNIENGALWYSGYPVPDMHKLQKILNELLGQKLFRVQFFAYKEVDARDENEAKEFLKNDRPKHLCMGEVVEIKYD